MTKCAALHQYFPSRRQEHRDEYVQ
jgi:hypothetical protein